MARIFLIILENFKKLNIHLDHNYCKVLINRGGGVIISILE